MKIALLGASGRVGSIIMECTLKDGHHVQAVVRNTEKIKSKHPNLSLIEGNVLNEKDIDYCFSKCHAVISGLGTDKNDVLSRSMPGILNSMRRNNITRIITIGTAGILQARETPSLYRFQTNESKRRSSSAAEDHLRMYLMLKSSELNWTIVCPTYLPDGERIGVYRTEKEMLPENGKSISIFDTAEFAFSLIHNEDSYRNRIGISY
ncbi:NAD(P)H-binding protein [Rossellomorea vietnamensis]|uniref:NAD(P)H-binding protein n=1 Tax=Rossellomorea vietnamensis TaxID=218284 RepID=A0A5D4NQ92_9BACI|nr:NAD(P)H-binding protein [Rossellomorea vietnamensis]TYS15476.1 NAD(P)H-binding protein [Rossellomorea vietnamensis]